MKTLILAFVLLNLFISSAWARPEYAVKHGYIQCSTCHVSPIGGGPRNLNGRLYGAHGLPGMYWTDQDMFSFDFRALVSYPTKNSATRSTGPALMEAVPWANVPVTKSAGDKVSTRMVAGYGLGGLAQGARDIYALVDLLPDQDRAALKHFMVGRFNAPFGLLTDEHRTFARQATMTTVNEYEFGVAASGDPAGWLHYDLALTNGFQSGGTQSTELPWAATLNVRTAPEGAPFFVGWSGSVHRKVNLPFKPYAQSLWTAVSVQRLTKGILPLTILGETVLARGWNDSKNTYINRFIPQSNTAWMASVAERQSLSFYAMAILDLTNRFALVYKFDEFAPDRYYTADAFVRHSAGFRWYLSSNAQLIARREFSQARRPGVLEEESQNSRNATLAIFHLTL